MLDRLKKHLVDDWHEALSWSSTRLHLAMLGMNLLFEAMPALDPQIAAMLPAALRSPAIGVYASIALVLRMTKLKPNG